MVQILVQERANRYNERYIDQVKLETKTRPECRGTRRQRESSTKIIDEKEMGRYDQDMTGENEEMYP